MSLSRKAVDEVTLYATMLWDEFLTWAKKQPMGFTAETLLDPWLFRDSQGRLVPPGHTVQNATAHALLFRAQERNIGPKDVVVPVEVRFVHPTNGLLATTSADTSNCKSRWVIDGANMIGIELVHSTLYEKTSSHQLRHYTKLFLHEVGHYVLHRADLVVAAQRSRKPPIATPRQEAEAWLFAHCLYGLAAADYAAAAREQSNIGDAWRYP